MEAQSEEWVARLAEGARPFTDGRVYAETLDKALEKASKDLDQFFGEGKWEFLEVRGRPSAQAIGGDIFLWEVDIEAGAVWG